MKFVLHLLLTCFSLSAAEPFAYQAGYNGTGAQPTETFLTPSNVSSATFTKLGVYTVDDYVYSQGLIVPQVRTPGGVKNLYITATMNATIFAFDAERPGSAPVWSTHFNSPIYFTSYPGSGGAHAGLIVDHAGCMSTPVADKELGYLFAVCSTGIPYVAGASMPSWKIHKLALGTGIEVGTGVTLTGEYPGAGDPGKNLGTDTITQTLSNICYAAPDVVIAGKVQFQGIWELNRVPLAISNGKVYSAWTAYGDSRPGHGWILANNESDLANVAAWCSTCSPINVPGGNNSPNQGLGSVWQGGGPMLVDPDGNLTVTTGNGSNEGETLGVTGATNYGNSVVKLSPTLGVLDFFVPSNYAALDAGDLDVSSSHPVLVPSQRLVVICSKFMHCYSISLDHFGHLQGSTSSDPQDLSFNVGGRTPTLITGAYSNIFMNGSLYVPMVDGPIQRFALTGSTFSTNPAAATTIVTNQDGANGITHLSGIAFPGGTLSGSYNSALGTNASDLIFATTAPGDAGGTLSNAFPQREPGTLRVFRGADLTEIYNSDQQTDGRDTLGTYAKFSAPVIAGGKVYVATWDNTIAVYGHLTRKAFLAHQ